MLFEFFYQPPEENILDSDPPIAPYEGAKVEINTPTLEGTGTIMQMHDVEGHENLKRLVIHTFDEHLQAELGQECGVKVLGEDHEHANGTAPAD